MDATTHTIYQEYLAVTLGNRDAAASLTLADAMQRTLDARTGPVAVPMSDGLLNIVQAASYLGCTPDGLRKIVARTQASQMGQRVNGPTIEFFQSRKRGAIRFRQEWLDAFIERHHLREGKPTIPKARRRTAKGQSALPGSTPSLAALWESLAQ